MSIILDSHRLTEKSYPGFLEKSILTSLANAMPDEVFFYPKEQIEDHLPSNMKPIEFPSTKGLFHQRKTEKWLQTIQPSLFISFTRTIKTNSLLKQILIAGDEDSLDWESIKVKPNAIGFTTHYISDQIEKKERFTQIPTFFTRVPVKLNETENNPEERDIKELFTEGKEYFISTDFFESKEKIINLLKSFSLFKRMQQSSWKMMLVVRATDYFTLDDAYHLISNYKYREDVVITDDDDLALKIREAYSLISVSQNEVFPVPIVESVLQQTPVIAFPSKTNKDLFGDAIVYTASESNEALADMMMMIYKGETFRKNIIKKMYPLSEGLMADAKILPLQQIVQKLQQEI